MAARGFRERRVSGLRRGHPICQGLRAMSVLPPKATFTVGVIGNMDIGEDPREHEELVAKVVSALRYLMAGPSPAAGETAPGRPFLADLPLEFASGLEEWTGLGKTPLVVLSSLAPGADTIGARAALQLAGEHFPVRLRCPLPFPKETYPRASTFAKGGGGDYEQIINVVPDADIFPVLLREHPVTGRAENDSAWWSPEAQDRWDADLEAVLDDGTKVRHLRYRAAGEYIAAYCDVLIVLWDDREEDAAAPSDTALAIHAKRRGLEGTRLPVTKGFTWADNGPVWHLRVARKKYGPPKTGDSHLGKWRILHPHEIDPEAEKVRPENFLDHPSYKWDCLSNEEAELEASGHHHHPGAPAPRFRTWQKKGNETFVRIGLNFRQFTAGTFGLGLGPAVRGKEDAWLAELDEEIASEVKKWAAPGEDARFADARAAMAGTRRAAAKVGMDLDERRKHLLVRLFHRAFLTAFLVHCFAHFHLGGKYEKAYWPYFVQAGLLAAAILTILRSLRDFSKYHSTRDEARRFDARALAEGLRVQLAWALAGIHRSAAANYMQRQRGELTWIRGAMSSLAVPYHQWLESWLAADSAGKLQRLRLVREKWVGEQAKYFADNQRKRRGCVHFWHSLGKVLALAGGGLFVCAAACAIARKLAHYSDIHPTSTFLASLGFAALLGIAARFHQFRHAIRDGWAGVWKKDKDKNGKEIKVLAITDPDRPADLPLWKGVKKDGGASLDYALNTRLLGPWGFRGEHSGHHGHDAHEPPLDPEKARKASRDQFLRLALAGAFLSLASFFIVFLLALCPAFPKLPDALIIVGASFSVAGALMIAWAEKLLYSEEAYHFNSMAIAFRAGDERLAHLLHQADKNPSAAPGLIDEAQELVFMLGKEALDENAEWLILHRARPMEPVFGA